MDDKKRLTKRYFTDLINLFFSEDSYFLLSIFKELRSRSLFDDGCDEKCAQLIQLLIHWLVNSQNTMESLDELAGIPGFSSFQGRLEEYMARLDIIDADRERARQSIAQIAQFTLSELESILDDQETQEKLIDYLEMRDGGNGVEQVNVPMQESDEQLADMFYQEEVQRALSSIDKYENMKSWEINKAEYFEDWRKCSQDIKSLSMMHGNKEVETIADRIYRIVGIHLSSDTRPSHKMNRMLNSGKYAIVHFMDNGNGQQDIVRIIGSFDKYINDVEDSLFNDHAAMADENEVENEHLEIADEVSRIAKASLEEDIALPGEDDPELTSLVGEILENQNGVSRENNEYNVGDRERSERDSYVKDTRFVKESSPYVDLIKRAMGDLKLNAYNYSALEDLELASSSLKGCALKFGYEDLSALPDTMENIAIILMNKKQPISPAIFPVIQDVIHFIRNFAEVDVAYERINVLLDKLNTYIDDILVKQDFSEFTSF